MSNKTKIFIRFIDGVKVNIPISANIVSENIFLLLPNKEFDYKDGTILFEYGVGDLVKCEVLRIDDNKKTCLLATELVKSGSYKNDYKRLLFDILQNEPDPAAVFKNHNKDVIEILLINNNYAYPRITDWIDKHRLLLKKYLQ